ncbi:MAG: tetratricopeptide repeat protein [bacterium]
MVKKRRTFSVFSLALLLALSLGCASSGKRTRLSMRVPPGLDSTMVVYSSRLADNNFVSSKREREAKRAAEAGKENLNRVDEFWAYLEQRVGKSSTLSGADQAQFDRELSQGAQALATWKKLTKNGQDENASEAAWNYCLQAQKHLEEAVRINPFDKNSRMLLSVVYYYLQNIFGKQGNYQKAVDVLERLVRIEKGEHELFRLLAENYQALGKYDLALNNFKRALAVLIKTSFAAPPDTSMIYYYTYAQGDVYARMYDAVHAIKTFKVAKSIARTEQEKSDVDNYLKWISWDGGNIRASEQWDKILAFESSKDYPKMVNACKKLLPALTTTKAKLNVQHKLAVVEFEILGQQARAVERMRRVFDLLPRNKLRSGDPQIQPILDSYGAMLYRLGVEAMEKQDKKVALAYFNKAVSFDWNQIGKAYFELVTLLWNDPDQAIQFGKKALASNSGLSNEESCELMSLMTKAHKSAGRYDEARKYYNKWKQCQE